MYAHLARYSLAMKIQFDRGITLAKFNNLTSKQVSGILIEIHIDLYSGQTNLKKFIKLFLLQQIYSLIKTLYFKEFR